MLGVIVLFIEFFFVMDIDVKIVTPQKNDRC